MYTVYIKTAEDKDNYSLGYVNVDNIVSIKPFSKQNCGHIYTNKIVVPVNGVIILHERSNDENWMYKLLSLIYDAKIESEESSKPIILDLSGSDIY